MPSFDNLANADDSYLSSSITLRIDDRPYSPHSPHQRSVINTNEIWSFQIRFATAGCLQVRIANIDSPNISGVRLNAKGLDGTGVSTSDAGPWVAANTTAILAVNSRGTGEESINFYFKAPGSLKLGAVDVSVVTVPASTYRPSMRTE